MLEIRVHGRGGQGAVVASKILADAIAREGKFVQAFPEFGVERRGAPVTAFIRVSDDIIYVRSKIYTPDHLLVLDPTLVDAVNILEGLKKGGWIVINTVRKPEEMGFPADYKVATVDATSIAIEHRLGSKVSPIVNTAILGALVKVLGIVSLPSLLEAIREGVPIKPDANVKAAEQAYNSVIM